MISIIIVQSQDFNNKIKNMGFNKKVYILPGILDDQLLDNFDIYKKEINNNILFMARLEVEKGLFIAIQSLSDKENYKLLIAGIGSLKSDVLKIVEQKKEIEFHGYVKNNKKIALLNSSTIYILPTYHGEGLPSSIVEAMAFGLPVITRPVGGIKDFFEDGKMGYITESKDPKVFADLIQKLLDNPEKIKEISEYNHKYAKEHFLASKVAKKLEEIYMSLM